MSDAEDITALRSTAHPLRLRVLLDAGEAVVASEERIRGGVAKRYRHPWREEEHGGRRRGVDVRTMAREMVRRAALREPTVKASVTDAELWVEPEVWERAMRLLVEASELVHAEAHPPRTEGTAPISLTVAAFGLSGRAS